MSEELLNRQDGEAQKEGSPANDFLNKGLGGINPPYIGLDDAGLKTEGGELPFFPPERIGKGLGGTPPPFTFDVLDKGLGTSPPPKENS